MPLHSDFVNELRKHFSGDIRNDPASRVLYSTDASIYQIEPLGVVIPRTQDDLQSAMELAAKYRLPVLPRGSGSSLAGQAIGEAIIVDCSRWLDGLLSLDAEGRTATLEPGLILSRLNQAAARHGLQYGPDPASAERATMGGVIANNATGAHSILYGMTADHLISAEVILSDGSLATFKEEPIPTEGVGRDGSLYSGILKTALKIRTEDAAEIQEHYPRSWRNSAGYRLNYLLPWSATRPSRWAGESYPVEKPGTINMPSLLAGSEGTLAIIRRATVHLVPKPKCTALGILSYSSADAACDAVPEILAQGPSAVELIPRVLLQLARSVPGYAAQMGWVKGDPAAVLAVEFSGDEPAPLIAAIRRLRGDVAVASSPEEQEQVWNVRKAGLGLLDARPQSARPAAFVEDCAIPVERLGDFVREVEGLLREHHTEGGMYGHASAGCLHIRPVLDLKTAAGVRALHSIGQQVLALTLRLGGAMASEHGDGIARGEWLIATYGPEIIGAMRSLKRAADPHGLLNPGKMFDAPPMDQHVRYGSDYRAHPWIPSLDFSGNGGLDVAVEQCNGQGVCRKDTGVMCPSFQATREEMHSTRGRANLLRWLIKEGAPPQRAGDHQREAEQAVFQALDLCLACKGCKAECPSGVDIAKLKFEFLSEYYQHHTRPLRDYIFGYFHVTAGLLSAVAPLVNAASAHPFIHHSLAQVLRITTARPFPRFSNRQPVVQSQPGRPRVIYLRDAFTHYVEPQVEQAAFDVLARFGFQVVPTQTMAAAAALQAKGFINAARHQANAMLDELARIDPNRDVPIVGVEPSEVYAFEHEYADLLPRRAGEIQLLSWKAGPVEEFLIRSLAGGALRIATKAQKLFFHPHCHERALPPSSDGLPSGSNATVALLKHCGYDVWLSDAGCCGMAGTFGYEAEHYELSQRVGGLRLFPRLHELADVPIAATGAACRMQIRQGTGMDAQHPLLFAKRALIPPDA